LNRLNQLSFDFSDRLRRQYNDPYTKGVLMRKGASSNRMGVNRSYQLYRSGKQADYLDQLFEFAEFGRANLFRDMIDDYKVKRFAGIPDSLLNQELELKQALAEYNQAILQQPGDTELEHGLFTTKEAYNDFVEELQRDYPAYHQLKYKSDIAPISAIQDSLLKDGTSIIEYILDDTAYYGLVITKDQIDAKWLGSITDIHRAVDSWAAALANLDEKAILGFGRQLYGWLFAPFESFLKGQDVIMIPTGRLFNISFEALNTGSDYRSFLIYHYNISYAISANTLFEQHHSHVTSASRPVIIAPGFETAIKDNYLHQLSSGDEIDSSFLKTVRQPWSRKMAGTIAKKFNGTALLDQNASEQTVRDQIQNRRVIHFATHAVADHQDPLRSKFVLAKQQKQGEYDGYLHAYEIYDLTLRSELAILTACESGQGKTKEGEGMISLAYSINYAGCPAVVMSLWKIDEKVNNLIVYDFYELLRQGVKKSEALRQAKLNYLESAEGSMLHPFYWSGLVVMGDPGPISLNGSNFRVWKWILIFFSFFIIALIASRRMAK
jgi:CHAT domain-containing protein